MKRLFCRALRVSPLALLLALSSCEGKQYVSPDTVRLVITDDSTNVVRVDRCNYVPELLGSEVKWRYDVQGDLKATLSITRDSVAVAFEGAAKPVDPYVVTTQDLRDSHQTDDSPPAGYTVELSLGCAVDKQ